MPFLLHLSLSFIFFSLSSYGRLELKFPVAIQSIPQIRAKALIVLALRLLTMGRPYHFENSYLCGGPHLREGGREGGGADHIMGRVRVSAYLSGGPTVPYLGDSRGLGPH